MKKKEIIFIAILLVVCLIAGGIFMFKHEDVTYARVIDLKNGQEIMRFDINEDNYYEIEVPFGLFHIEVKDGKYHAVNVDCPNQTCVSFGWMPSMGFYEPITCIPNGIMIEVIE